MKMPILLLLALSVSPVLSKKAEKFSASTDYLVLLKDSASYESTAAFATSAGSMRRLKRSKSNKKTSSKHQLEALLELPTHEIIAKVKFATKADLDAARRDPDVLSVEPDYEAHAYSVPSWGLDRV